MSKLHVYLVYARYLSDWKFDKDTLNHTRAITNYCKTFSTAVLTLKFDLYLSNGYSEIAQRMVGLAYAEHLREISWKSDVVVSRNLNRRNKRTRNQRTDQQTRIITIHLGGGNNTLCY